MVLRPLLLHVEGVRLDADGLVPFQRHWKGQRGADVRNKEFRAPPSVSYQGTVCGRLRRGPNHGHPVREALYNVARACARHARHNHRLRRRGGRVLRGCADPEQRHHRGPVLLPAHPERQDRDHPGDERPLREQLEVQAPVREHVLRAGLPLRRPRELPPRTSEGPGDARVGGELGSEPPDAAEDRRRESGPRHQRPEGGIPVHQRLDVRPPGRADLPAAHLQAARGRRAEGVRGHEQGRARDGRVCRGDPPRELRPEDPAAQRRPPVQPKLQREWRGPGVPDGAPPRELRLRHASHQLLPHRAPPPSRRLQALQFPCPCCGLARAGSAAEREREAPAPADELPPPRAQGR
mmetsp:Transcript_23516/g.56949  ORF Transcript_23516/g.56949 Transcript_23516/m.56949 type:complete len:351 (+) Transcript_23516:748-1800(+)